MMLLVRYVKRDYTFLHVFRTRIPANGNDWHMSSELSSCFPSPYLRSSFESIQNRHLNIHENQVKVVSIFFEFSQTFKPVGSHSGIVP